jgi:4-diphosphocytidyl-2C-methyl-D-erythritol kinase
MCGSGSAVFGLFPTVESARTAAAGLRRPARAGGRRGGGRPWHVVATRFIGRAGYRRRML